MVSQYLISNMGNLYELRTQITTRLKRLPRSRLLKAKLFEIMEACVQSLAF